MLTQDRIIVVKDSDLTSPLVSIPLCDLKAFDFAIKENKSPCVSIRYLYWDYVGDSEEHTQEYYFTMLEHLLECQDAINEIRKLEEDSKLQK